MLAEIVPYHVKGVFAEVMYVVFILAALTGWSLGKEEAKRIAEIAKRRKQGARRRIISKKPQPELTTDVEIRLDKPKPKPKPTKPKPKPTKPKPKPTKPIEKPTKEPLTSKDVVTDAISGLKNVGFSVRESKLVVKQLAEENKYECAEDLIRDVFKHVKK